MSNSMTIGCANIVTSVDDPISDWMSDRTVANSDSIIGHATLFLNGRIAAGALLYTAKKLAVHFRNIGRETGIDYQRR